MVRWFPVTEVVGDSLQVASAEPLVLLVPRLAPLEGVTGGSVTEDLLLAVQIERLNPQGQYHPIGTWFACRHTAKETILLRHNVSRGRKHPGC